MRICCIAKSGSPNWEAIFDLEGKKKELASLEEQMTQGNFWNDRQKAERTSRQASVLKVSITTWEGVHQQLEDLQEFQLLAVEEEDAQTLVQLEEEAADLVARVDALELSTILSDEDDAKDAILQINAGAGGTEASDWAEMLMRMYNRWVERRGFQRQIIDIQASEEAGIKGVTIGVKGTYAYGFLKAEAGVHRLVRISPFDSNSRRHTSFASVFVSPELDEEIEVELKDEELRVDVYRAGGAGGQHVNKTSSAVRITHIPTGITVQCQNERSQLKNKATARKVLMARLYQHYKEEEQKKRDEKASVKKSIDFGSQIRSYIFHPYNLVKDHRTNHETASVQGVMDGDLDGFIKAFLTQGQNGQ